MTTVFWVGAAWAVLLAYWLIVAALNAYRKPKVIVRTTPQTILSEADRKDVLIFHAVKQTSDGPQYHRPLRASQQKGTWRHS